MKYLCVLFLLLFSTNALATNWYVEKGASGLNNGTSWTNAWNELDKIVWSSVKPGDTVYLSGGASGLTYTTRLYNTVSGTAQLPLTIRVSQEEGRNGKVTILHQVKIAGNYVILNGAKSDSFTPPAYVKDIRDIINNINLEISNPAESSLWIAGRVGNKVFYVHSHDSGNAVLGTSLSGVHGLRHQYDGTPLPLQDTEIAYSWFNRNKADGINIATNYPRGFGEVNIHHVISEENGDDSIQIAGGTDLSYSYVGKINPVYKEGHPDTIQTSSVYVRVYNNEIIATQNSFFFFEARPPYDFANWLIYGNKLYSTTIHAPYGISLGTQVESKLPTDLVADWNNVVIANNTIFETGDTAIGLSCSPAMDLNIENTFVVNNIIVDAGLNASANEGVGIFASGPFWREPKRMNYDTTRMRIEYNTVSGWTTRFGWLGNRYQTAQEFNSVTGFLGNTNNSPEFLNRTGKDFRLGENDIAAKNKGVNLSEYLPAHILAIMPFITEDLEGKIRGENSEWDIGAYEYNDSQVVYDPICQNGIKEGIEVCDGQDLGEYTSNCTSYGNYNGGTLRCAMDCQSFDTSNCTLATQGGLLVHFDFEDYLADYNSTHGITIDKSGIGLKANCQNSLPLFNGTQTILNNQCPATTLGYDGNKAVTFDGEPLCFPNSDYLAFNSDSLKDMQRGTLSVWAEYDSDAYGGATIIDASGATSNISTNGGTWRLGRDSWAKCFQRSTRFMTGGYSVTGNCETNRADGYINDYTLFVFPDNYYDANTKKWNHYVVTWDGNRVKGYFNGNLFADVIQKTSLTINNFYVALGAYVHNTARNNSASGCITQYSCPDLGGTCPTANPEYVYPNNGFFSGKMDDVRIYNTPLTQNEINKLYNPTLINSHSICSQYLGEKVTTGQLATAINEWYARSITMQEIIRRAKIWKYCSN